MAVLHLNPTYIDEQMTYRDFLIACDYIDSKGA